MSFYDQMKACETQKDLDKLCQTECVLLNGSIVLQRQVYTQRCKIISIVGATT